PALPSFPTRRSSDLHSPKKKQRRMFQSRLFPLFSHIGKGNDEIEHNSRSLVVLHADENHHSTEHQHQQQEVEDGSVSHVPSEEEDRKSTRLNSSHVK